MHFDLTLTWGNLASIGTFITILSFGIKAMRYIKTCMKSVDRFVWEHDVVWGWYIKTYPEHVPAYQKVKREER